MSHATVLRQREARVIAKARRAVRDIYRLRRVPMVRQDARYLLLDVWYKPGEQMRREAKREVLAALEPLGWHVLREYDHGDGVLYRYTPVDPRANPARVPAHPGATMKKTRRRAHVAPYSVTVWDDDRVTDLVTHEGTHASVVAFALGYIDRFPPRAASATVMVGPNREGEKATAVWTGEHGAWLLTRGRMPRTDARAMVSWKGNSFHGWKRRNFKPAVWRPTKAAKTKVPVESEVTDRGARVASPAAPPDGKTLGIVAAGLAAIVGVTYVATRS